MFPDSNGLPGGLKREAASKYREGLMERLKNPDYAAEYLAQVLAEKDKAAFLVALKDVVEATGGMSFLDETGQANEALIDEVVAERFIQAAQRILDQAQPR